MPLNSEKHGTVAIVPASVTGQQEIPSKVVLQ